VAIVVVELRRQCRWNNGAIKNLVVGEKVRPLKGKRRMTVFISAGADFSLFVFKIDCLTGRTVSERTERELNFWAFLGTPTV
jgi:hypothetical protein